MKLTIKQYAENEGISVQSVYQKIKRGTLNSVEENGIKYVITEDSTVKRKEKDALKEVFKIIKRRDKEIKELRKQLSKCQGKKDKLFKEYLGQYQTALTAPTKNDDIVEVKIKKSKKKKDRNNRKN